MLRTLVAAFAALLALAVPALAADAAPDAAIKRTVEQRLTGMKVLSVTKTNYNALYEIRTDDNELFYTDEKVTFLFVGAIRDAKDPSRNLTEERIQALTAVKFQEMPFAGSFKMVRGNGKRQLGYFTDPNCPYCRQIEQEFLKLDDVTIHVFLYPILSAESAPRARNVWCSPDKAKAWNDLMLNGTMPAQAASNCNTTAIDQNLAFGRKIRVQSVPTLVMPNGVRAPGYRPAAQIAKMLDEAATAKN